MVSIEQQVAMWNKFIAMNEEYVVMYNDEDCNMTDEPNTYPVTSPISNYSIIDGNSYIECLGTCFELDDTDSLFDNLILYRLTSLDPQQELSMLDRGER